MVRSELQKKQLSEEHFCRKDYGVRAIKLTGPTELTQGYEQQGGPSTMLHTSYSLAMRNIDNYEGCSFSCERWTASE